MERSMFYRDLYYLYTSNYRTLAPKKKKKKMTEVEYLRSTSGEKPDKIENI